jgi:hypothetical protein
MNKITLITKKSILLFFIVSIIYFAVLGSQQTIGFSNWLWVRLGNFVVDVYDPQRAYNGTTLFADNSDLEKPRIVEVDMRGKVVWKYDLKKHKDNLLDKFPELVRFLPILPQYTRAEDVERLPNGNILFILGKGRGESLGLFEISQEGEIKWYYIDRQLSHDVDRLPNGNTIFMRGWVDKGYNHVVEIDADGNKIWSWDGIGRFGHTDYPDANIEGWMHANAVTRLKNGNTLISLRNFHRVVVVNQQGNVVKEFIFKLGMEEVQWPQHPMPHEPEVLHNGNIVVALTGPNVVWEFATGRFWELPVLERKVVHSPIWHWEHPEGTEWGGPYGHVRDANRLPNGNTLLVEGTKLIEVTPDNEIVWQLLNPSTFFPCWFYKAQRIGSDGSIWGH